MAAMLSHARLGELVMWISVFFVGCTLSGLAIGFALERLMPKKRIWSDALAEGQLRHELVGNVVFVLVNVAVFTAVLASGIVRFAEPGWTGGVLTFVALYGLAGGTMAIARSTIPLAVFPREAYARASARLALPLNLAFASAPPVFGAILTRASVDAALILAIGCSTLALSLLIVLALRTEPRALTNGA